MENAVGDGRVRSIGLSNFYEDDVDRILGFASIPPAVVQNETHIYFQERSVRSHIAQEGTVLESWYPLGGRSDHDVLFANRVVRRIARAHRKTPAQVLLRWHLQRGHVAIPGSSNDDHIRENADIFDLVLSRAQMRRLGDLDRGRRFSTY